jgi:hypothetical protein
VWGPEFKSQYWKKKCFTKVGNEAQRSDGGRSARAERVTRKSPALRDWP